MTKPIPYPAKTLANGWRFEVNTEQIKKSETWLRARTGLMRAHLLLLWTEAWEQSPCGSLPNDDELIALILDMDLEDFAKYKPVLMRGWWLAEDGRLYHDVIVTRVLDMLEKRMSNAERARKSRERKAKSPSDNANMTDDSQGSHPDVTRDAQVTDTAVTGEFDTKNQEPGTKNQEDSSLRSENTHSGDSTDVACVSSTEAGLICRSMKSFGISDVNPGHLDLKNLIEAGATIGEFEGAARDAASKQKGFAYAIGIVRKRREEAARAPPMHQGPMTSRSQSHNPSRKHEAHHVDEPA